MDVGLKRALEDKIYAGDRLTRSDGIALYASDDLAWLGRLAHHRRTVLCADRVMFALNRHLHITATSRVSCPYCAIGQPQDAAAEHPMEVEDAVRKAGELAGGYLTELHVIDDMEPALPAHYPRLLRELHAALPGVSLAALTAMSVHRVEQDSGRPAADLLDELAQAGLESFTGDAMGAQLPDDRSRWAKWARIHRLAHAKGLRTPSMMLYGHLEDHQDRVDHVLRLRALQDESGGLTSFVPVRYLPDLHRLPTHLTNAEVGERITAAPPAESLRTFAVSRLLLDNVPHIACSSAAEDLSLAQLLLNFGADELDGPVVADGATHDSPAAGVRRDDLVELIHDAGFTPVERDAKYDIIREYGVALPLAERRAEPQQVWA